MKAALYPWIKWLSRITLLAALLQPAMYYSAWRCGIIKFACMQPETQSMRDHYEFLANPLLGPAIDSAFFVSCLIVVMMVAELRYGARAGRVIKAQLKEAARRWRISLPLTALLIWQYFFYNKGTHLSGMCWFIVCAYLVAMLLVCPKEEC